MNPNPYFPLHLQYNKIIILKEKYYNVQLITIFSTMILYTSNPGYSVSSFTWQWKVSQLFQRTLTLYFCSKTPGVFIISCLLYMSFSLHTFFICQQRKQHIILSMSDRNDIQYIVTDCFLIPVCVTCAMWNKDWQYLCIFLLTLGRNRLTLPLSCITCHLHLQDSQSRRVTQRRGWRTQTQCCLQLNGRVGIALQSASLGLSHQYASELSKICDSFRKHCGRIL